MIDRAAALRSAMRSVVAERGLHGASMSTVAETAGVAAGTAYVHYESKDDLVLASYLEVKADLGSAVAAAIDSGARPSDRFRQLWCGAYEYFLNDLDAARFLVQFEASPLAGVGHERAMAVADDPLVAEAARDDLADLIIELPPLTLYDLAIGPAVRVVASGEELDADAIELLANACWRAITT